MKYAIGFLKIPNISKLIMLVLSFRINRGTIHVEYGVGFLLRFKFG